MKKRIIICVSVIGLFALLTAFKMPTTIDNASIVVANDVSEDYETVMKELEEAEKLLSMDMTEEERLLWTPVVALAARSAAVIRATVAVTRAAIAIARAASRALEEVTRASSGQLLTQLLGLAKVNKVNDDQFYAKLAEFQLYQLG